MAANDGQKRMARLALDVALAPVFVAADPALRAHTTYIVVDVIRATTTLAVMLGRGCRRVLIAPGIAEARAVAAREPGTYLLGGEAGGVAPPGFDFGNSPREYAAADLAGREIIFATTNGTWALRACAGGSAIYAGSFRNASAVARAAVASAVRAHHLGRVGAFGERPSPLPGTSYETSRATRSDGASEAALAEDDGARSDIIVVCAGRGGQPSYDDTLCAGYLIGRIAAEVASRGIGATMESGARIALDVCRYVTQRPDGLREALGESDAGRAIRAVGLEADLDWCAALDATDVVPYVAAIDAERDLLELRDVAREGA
jgi:2-phosphosulfolactate phosphatase